MALSPVASFVAGDAAASDVPATRSTFNRCRSPVLLSIQDILGTVAWGRKCPATHTRGIHSASHRAKPPLGDAVPALKDPFWHRVCFDFQILSEQSQQTTALVSSELLFSQGGRVGRKKEIMVSRVGRWESTVVCAPSPGHVLVIGGALLEECAFRRLSLRRYFWGARGPIPPKTQESTQENSWTRGPARGPLIFHLISSFLGYLPSQLCSCARRDWHGAPRLFVIRSQMI